jgi:hypothetical protein
MLYQFDRTHPHTTALLFVAKAVLKKGGTRDAMMYVYCDGERIVALDNHRVHVYAPRDCPLEEGFYKILKQTKTAIDLVLVKVEGMQQYPDFERVLSRSGQSRQFQYKDTPAADVPEALKLAQVLRAIDTIAVDLDYFREACPLMESYEQKDAFSPLLLTGPNVLAAIMPIQC